MENKKPWQSKSIWVSLLVALSAFYPPVAEWISGNQTAFTSILGGVFMALRLVTKSKISIE